MNEKHMVLPDRWLGPDEAKTESVEVWHGDYDLWDWIAQPEDGSLPAGPPPSATAHVMLTMGNRTHPQDSPLPDGESEEGAASEELLLFAHPVSLYTVGPYARSRPGGEECQISARLSEASIGGGGGGGTGASRAGLHCGWEQCTCRLGTVSRPHFVGGKVLSPRNPHRAPTVPETGRPHVDDDPSRDGLGRPQAPETRPIHSQQKQVARVLPTAHALVLQRWTL
ncbi:hypothetical protein DCS_03353 [Drechmeria coniospora]|uniref:Uncharacterized protein n=1 Tax=Drechmeria coniospora TaxID=98403 RepID=A0A151GGX1_DRECN|nr:hypothetical protein DCS_03353 [Drechmeria coniospora]KYK56353.1 hypothetical protein DCS_03353 [Drechmeria coniospora]